MAFYKNKAGQHIAVFAVDADGAPKTGDAANITATISLDADTSPDALTDENPVEIGGGVYAFDVEQAESNADLIVLIPTSVTADISLRPVIIYTEPEVRSCTVSDKTGFSLHADYDPAKTAAQAGALTTVDGVVDAVKVVTDKLDTALEADAAVYRFTANALEEGPTGGAAPTVGEIADAVWEEALVDHSGTAGSTAEQIANIATGSPPTAAAIRAEMDANSTQLAALVTGVSVSEVQTNAVDADAFTTDAIAALGEGVLSLDLADIEATMPAHSLGTAALKSTSRMRRTADGVSIETYRTDGVTLHVSQSLLPDPSGQPVLEIGTATAP